MFWKRVTNTQAKLSRKLSSPRRLRREASSAEGQALVEFALLTPLIFLLMVNVVNFGGFMYAWIEVANATRSAADYGILSSASPGSPSSPTTTQITSLITTDTASLPNSVSVCVNKNSTSSAITGTCSFTIASVPADPEGSSYSALAVDVSYTYTPFIPLFRFVPLHIYGTLPPTTLRRRAVMRVAN